MSPRSAGRSGGGVPHDQLGGLGPDDVRAQDLITKMLLERFPEHAIYGEEEDACALVTMFKAAR